MRAFLLLATLWCCPAFAVDVKVTTDDGIALHAISLGKGEQGVILVHDEGRTSQDWNLFANKLVTKGYRVVAVDLRGHGNSASILDATEPDWSNMVKDVQAASSWLKKQGAKQVSLVGAGLGANLSLELAAVDPTLKTTVLLSPGLNIRGFKPSKSIIAYGPRPIFLAAGEGDTIGANTVKYLEKQAAGARKLVVLPGEDRGANLLEENPGLEDSILNWLAGNYESAGGLDGPGAVSTGDVQSSSSQGVRFGEK